MTDTFDHKKIIDILFDPITSEIVAQLEDGEKELSYLAQKSQVSEEEIRERLSYLSENDFVNKRTEQDVIYYSANAEKLAKIVENNNNLDDAIDGLTKIDSYLN